MSVVRVFLGTYARFSASDEILITDEIAKKSYRTESAPTRQTRFVEKRVITFFLMYLVIVFHHVAGTKQQSSDNVGK
jgi:hypothetical protein